MNTIQELPIQNQQDFWSMLYMHLGKSIMEICGRRGEGAIRHGLHKMAEDDGRRFREECIKQGAKTNLRSLYAMAVPAAAIRAFVQRHCVMRSKFIFGKLTPARWPTSGSTMIKRF